MYISILDHLRCPQCRENLAAKTELEYDGDVIEGTLACGNGHTFRICNRVADFHSKEQTLANQWKTMEDEQRFDELDRDMDEQNPPEILQRRKLVQNSIAQAVSRHDCKTVLDIASGRGLMLTELARTLKEDVHIICVDLSAFVLKYDHRKAVQSCSA